MIPAADIDVGYRPRFLAILHASRSTTLVQHAIYIQLLNRLPEILYIHSWSPEDEKAFSALDLFDYL